MMAGPAPTDVLREDGSWDPDQVIESALSQLGRPYVWGGTGAVGVDCSGLIWRAFLSSGILLPKNSRAQRQVGRRVLRSELRRADLVAAVSRGPRRTSHVALALSPEEVIHACSERMAVRRESLADFEERYRLLTIRRIAGATSPDR
jgi:cell wall-associated NlpC family hydrolase